MRGFDIYTQHHDPSPTVLDDWGDADNQLGSPEESPPRKDRNRPVEVVQATGATGLALWEDVEHVTLAHSAHDTRGLQLTWTAPDVVYRSDTGGLALSPTHVLSMRIAQFFEDVANNLEGADLDLFVELYDGTNEAVVRLGTVATAPYPDATSAVLTVFRTARLPLDAFEAANPTINLGAIQRVRLLCRARWTGHVLVDDLEFVS